MSHLFSPVDMSHPPTYCIFLLVSLCSLSDHRVSVCLTLLVTASRPCLSLCSPIGFDHLPAYAFLVNDSDHSPSRSCQIIFLSNPVRLLLNETVTSAFVFIWSFWEEGMVNICARGVIDFIVAMMTANAVAYTDMKTQPLLRITMLPHCLVK